MICRPGSPLLCMKFVRHGYVHYLSGRTWAKCRRPRCLQVITVWKMWPPYEKCDVALIVVKLGSSSGSSSHVLFVLPSQLLPTKKLCWHVGSTTKRSWMFVLFPILIVLHRFCVLSSMSRVQNFSIALCLAGQLAIVRRWWNESVW